jgi:excisionase family DNA binding protein
MKYLSVQELSSYLNVKVKTIYSWISLKEIPHLKLGRLVRFDKEEIDRWIKQKKVDIDIANQKAIEIFRNRVHGNLDVQSVVKNAIEEFKDKRI